MKNAAKQYPVAPKNGYLNHKIFRVSNFISIQIGIERFLWCRGAEFYAPEAHKLPTRGFSVHVPNENVSFLPHENMLLFQDLIFMLTTLPIHPNLYEVYKE